MKIVWAKHAEDRQKEWEKKMGITHSDVEDLLKNPQQIVPGDMDALVAQSKRGNGLLRVPFKYWRKQENINGLLDKQNRKILEGGSK